jgi:hypothetical protein
MSRKHGNFHKHAYRVSIDLSSFRDDERSEAARSYREVLVSMREYDGSVRDIESRFSDRRGMNNGHIFFKYHGNNPEGLKANIEEAFRNANLEVTPINIRNPAKNRIADRKDKYSFG